MFIACKVKKQMSSFDIMLTLQVPLYSGLNIWHVFHVDKIDIDLLENKSFYTTRLNQGPVISSFKVSNIFGKETRFLKTRWHLKKTNFLKK